MAKCHYICIYLQISIIVWPCSFILEAILALLLILGGHFMIDNFYGLLGIYVIPVWCAVPLTMLTIVGIVNAINLIDGVDGLCSGYCIMACLLFAFVFSLVGDWQWTVLAMVCVGSLIPFFLHNVFGSESHIYIGDGGTLLMGVILSTIVILFNALVVLAWFASYQIGAKQSLQVIVVIVTGILVTGGFYSWMSINKKRETRIYRHFCWLGVRAHFKQTSAWIALQKMLDSRMKS